MADQQSAGGRVRKSITELLKGTGGIVTGAADVARDATVTTLSYTGDVAN